MNYEHLDYHNHYGAWEHVGEAIVFQPWTRMAYNPALLPTIMQGGYVIASNVAEDGSLLVIWCADGKVIAI